MIPKQKALAHAVHPRKPFDRRSISQMGFLLVKADQQIKTRRPRLPAKGTI